MSNIHLNQIRKMHSSTFFEGLTKKGKVFFTLLWAAIVSGMFSIAYNYLGR